MEKQRISAKTVLADIRAGMTDADLMEKHGISPRGLASLFQKLVKASLLEESEIADRVPVTKSVETLSRCPACEMPLQPITKECPRCGLMVSKFEQQRRRLTEKQELWNRTCPYCKTEAESEFYECPSCDRIHPRFQKGKNKELAEKLKEHGQAAGDKSLAGTIECPHCKEHVKQGAVKCPHCGENPQWSPARKQLNTVLRIVGAIILVLALLGTCSLLVTKGP